jgi:hypothetical protein
MMYRTVYQYRFYQFFSKILEQLMYNCVTKKPYIDAGPECFQGDEMN